VARLGAANVNEQFLFHGTSLENSVAIINNNFCLRKVRTHDDDTINLLLCAVIVN
jgi:hypothetical protein